MRILDAYIRRTIVMSILLALLILLTLVGFVTLMDELEDVGNGTYQLIDAFYYVILVLPRRAYEVFPMAVLLGSLVGLGGLASHSELVAIRGAGVSLARIVRSVMKAGGLVMLAVILVGEGLAPKTEQYAERMRAAKMANQITLKSKYGFWARDKNTFVNIRRILPGSQLQDIYIYEFSDDQKLQLSTHAEFARYQNDRWLLSGVLQTRFTADGVVGRQLEQAAWESMISPHCSMWWWCVPVCCRSGVSTTTSTLCTKTVRKRLFMKWLSGARLSLRW